jgi:FkbM family methyltransferase
MKKRLKEWLTATAKCLGVEVREESLRVEVSTSGPDSFQRLQHIKDLGFKPKVIYDCGAFIGKWAVSVLEVFPEAQLVLIEPNINLHDQIHENVRAIRERITLVSAALSDEIGEGTLNVWMNPKHSNKLTALAASSLLNHIQGPPQETIAVELKTLDMIIDETARVPDLLKIDLQGGELKALLGARKYLNSIEMCMVEFGCLEAYVERTTPKDLMEILYDHGFCLYDVVDLRYRPYDGALAGGDFLFVQSWSELRSHRDYF